MKFLQSPRIGSKRACKEDSITLAQFPVNCLALSAIIVPCVLLNSYFFLSNVEIIAERLLEIFLFLVLNTSRKKDLNIFKTPGSHVFSVCIVILISAFMPLSFAYDMAGRFMAKKMGLDQRKFCSCIYLWATVPAPIKCYVKEHIL